MFTSGILNYIETSCYSDIKIKRSKENFYYWYIGLYKDCIIYRIKISLDSI